MPDNDTLEAGMGDDTLEGGEGEAAIVEDESLEISIEGEEPEAEPEDEIEAELGDKGKRALQALRKTVSEATAKAKAAEAALAAERALKAAPAEDEAPLVEPTIEDCGYNETMFKQKMREFIAAEAKVEAKKQARAAEAKEQTDDYQARLSNFATAKAALKVSDFDTADAMVRAKLTQAQYDVVVRNSDNLANTIYALGKSKKALDDLAAIKYIDRFAFALAKTEGKITVTTKAPPPPESKLRGGVSTGGGSLATQLAAAEKEADRTGDRTQVGVIRRQMKAAGVKL